MSSGQVLIILITLTLFNIIIMMKRHCAHIMLFEMRQTVKGKVRVKGTGRLRMQCVFKEEEKKKRGKRMGDELL